MIGSRTWSRKRTILRSLLVGAVTLLAACNGGSTSFSDRFLDGTTDTPEIGLVVNSLSKALTMFQLGNPSEQRQIPFGTSSLITPVGLSVRGTHALVPLGNTASVALVDLEHEQVERFFLFTSGNATGSAFLDDQTFLAANTLGGYVGKATTDQLPDAITSTVDVAPAPTAIVVAGDRAYVVSSNYDETYTPIGNGIVTAIDPATMTAVGDVEMGDINSSDAALGPDGKLYVLNSGDFFSTNASVTIVNLATLTAETTVTGFPIGAGSIHIDNDGLAYVSSYTGGTVVWSTVSRTFVRDGAHAVCAGTPCPGAFDAARAPDHTLYQVFFGSGDAESRAYIYAPVSFQLIGSVPLGAGTGSTSIDIVRFRALSE